MSSALAEVKRSLEKFFRGKFFRSYRWQLLIVLLVVLLLATPAGRGFLTSPEQTTKFIQVAGWPAVVALAVVLLIATSGGRRLLAALPGRVSKVSAFGVELDLTAEVAKEVRESVKQSLDEYRQRINNEFDRQVETKQINELRIHVVEEGVRHAISERWMKEACRNDYRSTIHVRDVLYHDAMYQLLDYYPQGGGRSRTFSIRRGILGVSWRLPDDQIDGKVPTAETALIKNWAMTAQEAAEAARGRKSFACILLRAHESLPIGVLYFDSQIDEAFDDKTTVQLANYFRQLSAESGLTEAVSLLHKEMRDIGPALTLFA